MLNDDVLPVNTAATAKGTNCDVTAAAGMMSSVTQKCGITPVSCDFKTLQIEFYPFS